MVKVVCLGVVIRDDEGRIVTAATKPSMFRCGVSFAEAKAAEWGRDGQWAGPAPKKGPCVLMPVSCHAHYVFCAVPCCVVPKFFCLGSAQHTCRAYLCCVVPCLRKKKLNKLFFKNFF